jgi:malonate-semialdehyde dehydrogenase (acetylating) / methylmalonate-semialdehyde dehydrogenase
VVHGDAVAVNRLLTHPGVRAVSFVGSTPVVRHVCETATSNGKRVQALGGAKNHMVVTPDADLDAAADAAVSAEFGSAGERCMAVSVVAAVEPIGDELVARIAERRSMISLVGISVDGSTDGFWLGPTLFDNMPPEASICTDEIFGPVLSAVRAPSTLKPTVPTVRTSLPGPRS